MKVQNMKEDERDKKRGASMRDDGKVEDKRASVAEKPLRIDLEYCRNDESACCSVPI
jgi:hypothetical protein